MERERDKILKLGAIKLYSSSWASLIVQINKKNGDMHFCAIFCELNPVAVFDAYTIPQVDILESMGPANTCPLWTWCEATGRCHLDKGANAIGTISPC